MNQTKRLLAILLSLAFLFTVSMPVLAVEDGPALEEPTTEPVTEPTIIEQSQESFLGKALESVKGFLTWVFIWLWYAGFIIIMLIAPLFTPLVVPIAWIVKLFK